MTTLMLFGKFLVVFYELYRILATSEDTLRREDVLVNIF